MLSINWEPVNGEVVFTPGLRPMIYKGTNFTPRDMKYLVRAFDESEQYRVDYVYQCPPIFEEEDPNAGMVPTIEEMESAIPVPAVTRSHRIPEIMARRHPIGSKVFSKGTCIGEIMAYGSDIGEIYLVDNHGAMLMMNRKALDDLCEVDSTNCELSWWGSKEKERKQIMGDPFKCP